MSYADDTIDWQSIRDIDAWLDRAVSGMYTDQPLAQDWARLSKVAEELSEALEELPEDATAPRRGSRYRTYRHPHDSAFHKRHRGNPQHYPGEADPDIYANARCEPERG
jgi:hypothetical protein